MSEKSARKAMLIAKAAGGEVGPNGSHVVALYKAPNPANHIFARKLGTKLSPETLKLARQVHGLARKIAPRADVIGAHHIYEGRGNPDEEIYGVTYHNGMKHAIAWSLQSPDAIGTIRHEALHYLRRERLIQPDEWATLNDHARRENWVKKHNINDVDSYRALHPDAKREEAIASEMEHWRRAPQFIPKAFHPVYERVSQFMGGVGALARKALGRPETAGDVMGKIMSGQIGRREQPGNVPAKAEGGALTGPSVKPHEHPQLIASSA